MGRYLEGDNVNTRGFFFFFKIGEVIAFLSAIRTFKREEINKASVKGESLEPVRMVSSGPGRE